MRNLLAPRSFPGAEGIVSVATGSVQATMQLSAVIAEKIKHKHSQKESNFPLPSLTSALPPCSRPLEFIQPLATRAEAWAGHPRSVRVGYGDNKTRLFTPIRSKTPALQRRGLHLGAGRERSRSALRGDDAAGKRSHRNGFSSFERVRLLQPLLPRPQKGWRPPAHPRSQTPESRPHETAVQDDHAEADPLADLHRGLVLFSGPERRILSHPDSPHHRRFLRFAFEGVAYQYTVLPFGLSLAPRTFTKCMDAALSPLRQMESAFSTTSTTGSFWPSQRWNYFHTEPSSSAT